MLMDLQTCLKKMQLVGVLAFATVDSEGHRRSAISARFIMSRMPFIFLRRAGKIFAGN